MDMSIKAGTYTKMMRQDLKHCHASRFEALSSKEKRVNNVMGIRSHRTVDTTHVVSLRERKPSTVQDHGFGLSKLQKTGTPQ